MDKKEKKFKDYQDQVESEKKDFLYKQFLPPAEEKNSSIMFSRVQKLFRNINKYDEFQKTKKWSLNEDDSLKKEHSALGLGPIVSLKKLLKMNPEC